MKSRSLPQRLSIWAVLLAATLQLGVARRTTASASEPGVGAAGVLNSVPPRPRLDAPAAPQPREIHLPRASHFLIGKKEKEVKLATVATTTLKRGGHTYSRFSSVVQIRAAGHYRAYVKLGKGPYVSGASSYVTIRTVAPVTKRVHHKHAKKHKK